MSKRHLLYGSDNEEGIVSVEVLNGQNIAHIFTRTGGTLSSRYVPFSYIIWANDKIIDGLIEYDLLDSINVEKLPGGNFYNLLITTNDTAVYKKIKYTFKDLINVPYIQSQYMLQSGKTNFKGMVFNDVKSLTFDIEVVTTKGFNFPNAEREGDEVIIIAIKRNDGVEKVLSLENPLIDKSNIKVDCQFFKTEKKLLEALVVEIREFDPDVLFNHNIFNFDIQYIRKRCEKRRVEFKIGRDGSEPSYFDTQIKFADKSLDYTNCSIYGRSVIDTMFLARYADVVLRDMPSYQLKDLIKYLGKAEDDRTYIEGDEIAKVWRGESKHSVNDLINYAVSDVREADILYHEYGMSTFTMTQMIPMNYQEVFRYGTGNQIETVFMREYLRVKHSYPKASPKRAYGGGYASVVKFGLINEPIIYADVKSLYPSLAKILKIQPKKDELGIFQDILLLLMSLRFEIKAKIMEYENEPDLKRMQKATDGSVKIMLNTMSYGYIGWEYGSFNDMDEAERITVNGQIIVKSMKDEISRLGGEPIKIDTDGIACVVPNEYRGSFEKEKEFCKVLTDLMPEGIEIEHDGRYAGILAIDAKSYALKEYDGTIKIKGNTLRGRNIEHFGIKFIEDVIKALFDNDYKACKEHYLYWKKRIENYEVEAEEIAKRNTLNNSLDEYKMKISSGVSNRAPQYELAVKADTKYIKGDTVKYYIKEFPVVTKLVHRKYQIKKIKLKAYEAAEFIENFNNDIEVSYYLERLELITKKFITLGIDLFTDIFNVNLRNADIKKYEKITNNIEDENED